MRRELLVIATITALALVAIAAFGGAFRLQPVNEARVQTYAPPTTATLPDPNDKNLADPTKRARMSEIVIRAAGTGAPVDGRKQVRVVDQDANVIAETTTFGVYAYLDLPANLPLQAVVYAAGWNATTSAPFIVRAGVPQTIEVHLTKPVWVTVNLIDPDQLASNVAIAPLDLPVFPSVTSETRVAAVFEGNAHFNLNPGRWACVALGGGVGRGVAPKISRPWRVLEFEVGHTEMTLVMDMTSEVPATQPVSGLVVDDDGLPVGDARVVLELLGPGPIVYRWDDTYTTRDGAFNFSAVPEGICRISVDVAAGRAEVVVAPAQRAQPAHLKLERWIAKGRGVMPSQPIGSVRVLRRGQPVAGAKLVQEEYGTLARSYYDFRPGWASGDAGADGVIHLDKPEYAGTSVVHTRPYSPLPFEVRVKPGAEAQAEFELAPPGTATVRIEVGTPLAAIFGVHCQRDGEPLETSLIMKPDQSGFVEFCGLTPGRYTILGPLHEEDGFQLRCPIELKPDQDLLVQQPFKTRSMGGAWPTGVSWQHYSELIVADPTNPNRQSIISEGPKWSDVKSWAKGPSIQFAPTVALQLILKEHGRAVAVSEVQAGTVEVKELTWRRLIADSEGGSVGGIWSGKRPTLADIWLGDPQNVPVRVRRTSVWVEEGAARTRLKDVPPGKWRVIICAANQDWRHPTADQPVLDTVVEIEAGKEVMLAMPMPTEPVAEVFRADARIMIAGVAGDALWHMRLEAPQRKTDNARILHDRMFYAPLVPHRRLFATVIPLTFGPKPGELFILHVPGFAPREFLWPEGNQVEIDLRQ